jgi:hypothetical protein
MYILCSSSFSLDHIFWVCGLEEITVGHPRKRIDGEAHLSYEEEWKPICMLSVRNDRLPGI